ncbi:interleukin-1 receptor-associated kinase 1 isoform X2 [Gadus macrocephalus]|uniref:interleukin-1 receptor-associated kinase 1 isoform X2 n=1 Tax=Gadus macrocephalus TaxID=80720 RepID=UPI0028CB357A|nr:interleukin-1 receptor-associated kinase 1 isoform X2 [Gadus macrocephalus]
MSTSEYLYELPPAVWFEFCRLMDGLSETQWVRFASEILSDQTDVRLAERRERRTDYVINQWANRNGQVGELIGLLERQQLLRARDVILTWRAESVSRLHPHSSHSQSYSAPKPLLVTCSPPTKALIRGEVMGGARMLPKPGPPPSSLQSRTQPPKLMKVPAGSVGGAGGMCWSHDELETGTDGFSPSRLVGEGGFGSVYQASMGGNEYAVKVLRQGSSLLDWSLLKETFKTEVEKLSKYRHPNLMELVAFSMAQDSFCLLSRFMSNGSLQSQLVGGALSWEQRVGVAAGTSRALQYLHIPPPPLLPLIHGDVRSTNILLDRHLAPKLGDFGLGVFSPRSVGAGVRTSSVGRTSVLRVAQAYLPQDHLQDGRRTPGLDVYSFGVVLLELLTGRRAVETEGSRTLYLKDLLDELLECPGLSQSGPSQLSHLDPRLRPQQPSNPGGVTGSMDVSALACRCLHKNRKKRPAITEVSDELQDLLTLLRSSTSPPSSLCPPSSLLPLPPPAPFQTEVRLGALVRDMAQLGTLEHSSPSPSPSSLTSSSSVTSSSLTSSSSVTSSSLTSSYLNTSSLTSSPSEPCESDESVCLSSPRLPPGVSQPGLYQSGVSQSGVSQSGVSQSGVSQPGLYQSGVSQSGLSRPGLYQSGVSQPGLYQSGVSQSGLSRPGLYQSGVSQPGLYQSGLSQPGLYQSGLSQPGLHQPGLSQPGLHQPGLHQPGLPQPGLPQPGLHQSCVSPSGVPRLPPGAPSSSSSSPSRERSPAPSTQGPSTGSFLPSSLPPSLLTLPTDEDHAGRSGPEESDELDFLN